MGYKSITTSSDTIVIITTDGTKYEILPAEMSLLATEQDIKTSLEGKAGKGLPDVFVHVNGDGTKCVVTGNPILVWPEDKVLEEYGDPK